MALFGIQNGEVYAGLILLILLVVFVIWLIRKGGRAAEEKEEEKETEKLKKDEKQAEKAQKDERKQCKLLDAIFSEIMTELKSSGNTVLADQLYSIRQRITSILIAEMGEKMNVKSALDLFKQLHALINDFISKLPTDNAKINDLVQQIKVHQKKYYDDLVLEINLDEDKKQELRKLWKQVIDEETGNAAA